jgi:SAM-dependent methyltransferase
MARDKIIDEVRDYYTEKLGKHGATPQGVDWNGAESQILRFDQLSKLFESTDNASFSVTDLGCGYGAYIDYLSARFSNFEYVGYDISSAMIAAARQRYATRENIRLIESSELIETTDYCVASGIFNVRIKNSDELWVDYVNTILDMLDQRSRSGFAFNCLTSYSDADRMHDYLYYVDPCQLFDFCKRRYSRNVALLHDYDLYEFTILVRKL